MPVPEREPPREAAPAHFVHESCPIGHDDPGYRADGAVEVDTELSEEEGKGLLLRQVGPHPAWRGVLLDDAVKLSEPDRGRNRGQDRLEDFEEIVPLPAERVVQHGRHPFRNNIIRVCHFAPGEG